jgi:hypothetical protein
VTRIFAIKHAHKGIRATRYRVVAAFAVLLGEVLTAPTASALPPGFPDLNAFTAVDPESHIVHYLRGGSAVTFATPDGVQCNWPDLQDPNAHTDVRCSGNIPGIPAFVPNDESSGCPTVSQAGGLVDGTLLYVFSRHGGWACPPFPSSLNVGEKISSANITCAVAQGNVTACVDQMVNHGFVLRPSGSWVF